jgi:hypothetical protein
MYKNKMRIILPLGFFIFISFIIYLADTANYNFAFRLIGDIPYGDKLMHTLLYGIMALLLNYGFNYKSYKNLQIGAMAVLLFAVLEEITQYWIPSRTFDLKDLFADVVGVVLFSFIRWGKSV